MAVGVVVGLEVVDVDHHERQGPALAEHAPPLELQALVEVAAVGDAGDRVEVREPREHLVSLLQLARALLTSGQVPLAQGELADPPAVAEEGEGHSAESCAARGTSGPGRSAGAARRQGGALLVPDSVVVGGHDLEAIRPRRNVRVVGDVPRARVDPVTVETHQPILEAHLLRLEEAEAGVMDLDLAVPGRHDHRVRAVVAPCGRSRLPRWPRAGAARSSGCPSDRPGRRPAGSGTRATRRVPASPQAGPARCTPRPACRRRRRRHRRSPTRDAPRRTRRAPAWPRGRCPCCCSSRSCRRRPAGSGRRGRRRALPRWVTLTKRPSLYRVRPPGVPIQRAPSASGRRQNTVLWPSPCSMVYILKRPFSSRLSPPPSVPIQRRPALSWPIARTWSDERPCSRP